DAQTHGDRVRAELKAATDRVEQLTAARDEQSTARRTAEGDLRKAREAADSLRADLANATKGLEKASAERQASEELAAEAASQSQAAEAKLAAVTDLLTKSAARIKTLEQAQHQHERTLQDLEVKLEAAQAAPAPAAAPSASVLDDLVASFEALGAATTIAEV